MQIKFSAEPTGDAIAYLAYEGDKGVEFAADLEKAAETFPHWVTQPAWQVLLVDVVAATVWAASCWRLVPLGRWDRSVKIFYENQ